MAAASRVALVTGGNRGIGYEICRQLGARGLTVLLGSRDPARGKAAARRLQQEGLAVEFQRLDVSASRSIRAAVDAIVRRHARIDVLVNNAGIMIDRRGSRFLDSRIPAYRRTLETNLYGPLLLAQAVVPSMKRRRYGRIVNMSSSLGQLSDMGVGTPAYRISKAALNALTGILAAELEGTGVLVNAMSPGWVRTAMGGNEAPLSAAQGADTAVWLATLPANGASGGFFRDRKPIAW
jgi:NAD(P)-dependent dehydrogenase (short-subunit alcohol dehydrogenase family)